MIDCTLLKRIEEPCLCHKETLLFGTEDVHTIALGFTHTVDLKAVHNNHQRKTGNILCLATLRNTILKNIFWITVLLLQQIIEMMPEKLIKRTEL